MSVEDIAKYAQIKGLNLVGSGDFTHPSWLSGLKENLAPEQNTGLYRVARNPDSHVLFMVTTEVCTIFAFENETKKVHHVILTPDIETAIQTNDRLSKYGDLAADGRPTLDMSAPHLVEEVMEASNRNMVIPAHAWTPWFSVFGAFSGFDSVEECYQDMSKHIHALETGLSSDPPMNWRLSSLDRYALVSNSDCHSFWPWRIGREANVFELETLSYSEVVDAICSKDNKRFLFTIETDPAYGKYHWTGHRNCKVSLSPRDAERLGNVCPVCRRRLTKGVEQRVEELADRPAGFVPDSAVGFRRLLPLSEIIQTVLGVDSPSTQRVWGIYNRLVERFGNEYAVLLDAPMDSLSAVAGEDVAAAVVRVREGQIMVIPGYDGVYGRLVLSESGKASFDPFRGRVEQRNLADFM
jgi:uncharacterized protein (TIGR00375 family)